MTAQIVSGVAPPGSSRPIPGYIPRGSVRTIQQKIDGAISELLKALPNHDFGRSCFIVFINEWAADLADDTQERIFSGNRVSPLDLAASVPNALISRLIRPFGFRGGIATIFADVRVSDRYIWDHPMLFPFLLDGALIVDLRDSVEKTEWSYRQGLGEA